MVPGVNDFANSYSSARRLCKVGVDPNTLSLVCNYSFRDGWEADRQVDGCDLIAALITLTKHNNSLVVLFAKLMKRI